MIKNNTVLSIFALSAIFLSTVLSSELKDINLIELRETSRLQSDLLKPVSKKTASLGKVESDLTGYNKVIGPILEQNCMDCHGPKKSKGRFRVDTLNPDLIKGEHINEWVEVFDVLTNEEMPPEDEPDYHLDGKQRSLVVDWLGVEMNKASQVKRGDIAHSSFRRMTKDEYNYALQDLFGVDVDFSDELSPETVSEDGFSNSSEHLKMTAMQFQAFHEVALKALKKVTVKGDKPEVISYQITMPELMALTKKNMKGSEKKKINKLVDKLEKEGKAQEAEELLKQELIGIDINTGKTDGARGVHVLDTATGKGWAYRYGYSKARWMIRPNEVTAEFAPTPIRAIIPWGYEMKLDLGNFLPDKGDMRVRLHVGRDQIKENEYSSIQLLFGGQTSNNANFIKRATDKNLLVKGTKDKPQFVEFDIPLSEMPRNPFLRTAKLGTTPSPSEVLTIKHMGNSASKLLIDYIEVQAPIYEQWPSQSHSDIFIASKNKNNESIYASEVIKNFSEKAWCRTVGKDELVDLMALYHSYRPQFTDFEDAVLEVLASVLSSAEFLYIQQDKSDDVLADIALAHRLSHFIWKSIPDQALLDLAKAGKLNNEVVLKQEVERMLDDPKAERFTQSFVREWLHLEALNNVIIDKKVFPAYKEGLKEDMELELTTFFSEALKENVSIMDFLHSDYVFVNERLAKHYGLSGVYGEDFRRVALNNDYKRGGVLTASALLAMNANGKESNPLKRGIWILENILHDPPPPAPPNVPEVDLTDPRILQMTLKERMEDHRNHDACRSCHAKIDPWGIAFENYDALGQYRDHYKKKPVDASAILHNQHKLEGIKGLKAYLLADRQDQFTEAMVHKMLTYALGRPLSFNDKVDKEEISRQLRQKGDGLRDLVHIIVNSKTFLNN